MDFNSLVSEEIIVFHHIIHLLDQVKALIQTALLVFDELHLQQIIEYPILIVPGPLFMAAAMSDFYDSLGGVVGLADHGDARNV